MRLAQHTHEVAQHTHEVAQQFYEIPAHFIHENKTIAYDVTDLNFFCTG